MWWGVMFFFLLLMRGGRVSGTDRLKRPCLEIATDARRIGRPRSATAAACSRVSMRISESNDTALGKW